MTVLKCVRSTGDGNPQEIGRREFSSVKVARDWMLNRMDVENRKGHSACYGIHKDDAMSVLEKRVANKPQVVRIYSFVR